MGEDLFKGALMQEDGLPRDVHLALAIRKLGQWVVLLTTTIPDPRSRKTGTLPFQLLNSAFPQFLWISDFGMVE